MEIKAEKQKEKISLMVVLLAVSCCLTYYFHQVLGVGTVFTHFFYIPIILGSLWWKRKGLAVAIFLALFLVFSQYFLRHYTMTGNDYLRALMFIVVGLVVALLSGRIAKAQGKTAHLNAILAAIWNVNQLIAREKDRDNLIKAACGSLIEPRGYYNAWIALLDDKRELVKTAEAGLGKNFLPMVEWLKRSEMPKCGQKALKQSDIVVTKTPSSCADCPLAHMYNGRGALTVRLEHEGKIYGLLCASIPIDFIEDKEDRDLFQEVARDIAFALYSIEQEEGRKRAEEELRKHHNYLEELVGERTAALTKINEQLNQDITDRKRAEEALKESEERFREMARLLPNIICEMDLNLGLTYINNLGIETFGYTQDEFDAGFNLVDLIHPDDREKVAKRIEQITKGITVGPIEYRVTKKDGSELAALVNTSPIYKDGQIAAIRASITDITERKKMQAEILKAKKLESIATLAGGIAHDFNNLLTVILGNISLAHDDIKPEIGTSKNLKEAEKASIRAKELTARLITFSRGGEPVKDVASIGDLVMDSVSSLLRVSNIDCEFSIPGDLWAVLIDEQQINQVIQNIIINAQEAMAGEGRIKVYGENLDVGEKDVLTLSKGKYVKISIQDLGPGIPEENLQKIFDPYFSTKEMGSEKGMGLGLAICYSIVEKHDGLITVESELGTGTTFIIYLPAIEKEIADQAPRKKAVPARPVTGKGKILVMDDEEMVRDVSAAMINKLGYEAEVAVEGAEAIEMYKRARESGEPFDVVILDLTNKFGMGGKETCARLLEIDPEVRALISSGYSANPIMSNFAAYGFRGVLAKPFNMDKLRTALHGVITGEDE